MSSVRRAVIDVGTNSVKLLVADIAGGQVQPVWEDSKQTRLGSGFYETRQLQVEPITKTAKAAAKFSRVAHEYGAVSIRVIATSATRDANNAYELLNAIEQASGLKVEIISGELEAELAFQGVMTDGRFTHDPVLILDVGGGSTEFILGRGQQKYFRESFPIGTVRLMEQLQPGDPPRSGELASCRKAVAQFLTERVQPKLGPAINAMPGARDLNAAVQLVGTGGTASILGRMEAALDDYDRDRIEAACPSLTRLNWHVEKLWSLPLVKRQQIVGLPPKRADVILTGVLIFEAVMELFGFSELRVSTRGLRFAAVMTPQLADLPS